MTMSSLICSEILASEIKVHVLRNMYVVKFCSVLYI